MADVLVACPTLLAFLGVANAAAARSGNLYIDTIGDEPEEIKEDAWIAKFPNVIIGTPGDEADSFVLQQSTVSSSQATGVIELVFAQIVDETKADEEQERQFKNSVGSILEEMQLQVMSMPEIAVQEYGRNPRQDWETVGRIQSCVVHVSWGTEPETSE